MSCPFFIRHYLRNPLSFYVHHLLICLNSEGNFSKTGYCVERCSKKLLTQSIPPGRASALTAKSQAANQGMLAPTKRAQCLGECIPASLGTLVSVKKIPCVHNHSQSMDTSLKTPAKLHPGLIQSAACVQISGDSRNPAIRIEYRSLLRSSSFLEPRHSPLQNYARKRKRLQLARFL